MFYFGWLVLDKSILVYFGLVGGWIGFTLVGWLVLVCFMVFFQGIPKV